LLLLDSAACTDTYFGPSSNFVDNERIMGSILEVFQGEYRNLKNIQRPLVFFNDSEIRNVSYLHPHRLSSSL